MYIGWLGERRGGEWVGPWMWFEGRRPRPRGECGWRASSPRIPPVLQIEEEIGRRSPWLDDVESDQEPLPRPVRVQIEMRIFFWVPWEGGWSDRGAQSQAISGLWMIEAAQGMTNVMACDGVEVRGVRCQRYRGEARPIDVVGQPGIELVTAEPADRWRSVIVEACIDADGFVRRLAVT